MDVVLRPWHPSDAGALFAAIGAAPDLAAQFRGADVSSRRAVERHIRKQLARPAPNKVDFAIEMDGVAVGNVGISRIEHVNDTGWVFYWLAPAARGHGLATRALATVSAWAFDEGALFRLELGHRVNNPASCRVATRAGFVAEGVERQKLRYGSERFDVETHSRLRSDAPPSTRLLPVR